MSTKNLRHEWKKSLPLSYGNASYAGPKHFDKLTPESGPTCNSGCTNWSRKNLHKACLPIPGDERLAVTLRWTELLFYSASQNTKYTVKASFLCTFLATGDSYWTIGYYFRIHTPAVSKIVPETSQALWQVLTLIYMPALRKETWRRIVRGYYSGWNFPKLCGFLDGKNIVT